MAKDITGRLVRFDDLPPPDPEGWLIKGWLERGAVSVLYGDPGAGKTFLALDMAFHVAVGRPWHNCSTTPVHTDQRTGGAVYIPFEGNRGLGLRRTALKRQYPSDFDFNPIDSFIVLEKGLDLQNDKAVGALIEALNARDQCPRLIVIDTLARAIGDADENSGKGINIIVSAADRLTHEYDCHVMVVHHTGKDKSKTSRGHTSLKGAIQTEIFVSQDKGTVTAEIMKHRDDVSGRKFCYRLTPVEVGKDAEGERITSCVVTPVDLPKLGPKRPHVRPQVATAYELLLSCTGGVGREVALTEWKQKVAEHEKKEGNSDGNIRSVLTKCRKELENERFIEITQDKIKALIP